MALEPGTRFGPYEVVEQIGSGGMGEIYRATDTKLKRDVAIKTLPAGLAQDPDRLARFEREAKLLAALNHPHIGAIYALDEHDGTLYLAMELIEGETLETKLKAGALPVDDALRIALQIVQALEAAHDKGVVHRDLKPANVMISRDGLVKVVDFGLAKAFATDPEGASPDNSPALSVAMTQAGLVLGTAGYMSPEQASGQATDQRADIWAFGVVLYEMLSGLPLFSGESVPHILAEVLKTEPDWGRLPKKLHPRLRLLLERCLEKKPRNRYHAIADARVDIEKVLSDPDGVMAAVASSSRPQRVRLLAAGLAVGFVLAAGLAAVFWNPEAATAPGSSMHLSIALPYDHTLVSGPAISRDGQRVAFTATDGIEPPQLYVRNLDEAESRPIPGTEDADQPLFSPDGRSVAFYAKGGLFKVSLGGGIPVRLAESSSNNGGTWTDDGRIVFNRTWNGGLFAVPENGGEARLLAEPSREGEYAYVWPYALEKSRELVFSRWGDTFSLVSLDLETTTQKQLTASAAGSWRRSVVTATGHLVFAGDGGELRALPFGDAAREAAGEVTVLEHVNIGGNSGDAHFDVADNGTLAYVLGESNPLRLVRVNLSGQVEQELLQWGDYGPFSLSPDGRQVAVKLLSEEDLQVIDLASGRAIPLDTELSNKVLPVWSRDGRRIAVGSNQSGNWELYAKAASGAGSVESLYTQPLDQFPLASAPDGALLFEQVHPETGSDLWILLPDNSAESWLATNAEEQDAQFSPDGDLIAYASNASGRFEVYVAPRDDPQARIRVSVDGGQMPRWSPDGSRLYFRRGSSMLTASIETAGGLSAGIPQTLFDGDLSFAELRFDVTPDGESFIMMQRSPESIPTRIEIVTNWTELLEQEVPVE